jgi:hypothetical protein
MPPKSLLFLFSLTICAQTPNRAWTNIGRDAQHAANAPVKAKTLKRIRWQTPVDLAPQLSGSDLLIHYGSPLITQDNTVIVPVKTGAMGGYRVEAHKGSDGSLQWMLSSDWVAAPHNWTPSFAPALTSHQRLFIPAEGGTVLYRNQPGSATGATGRLAFFGLSNYNANPAAYNSTVMISTPIMADSAGDIYFGFYVTGSNPSNLQGGIARIDASGHGTWISATAAAQDAGISQVVLNCAPAFSMDQQTVYITVGQGADFSAGYLVALDATTLQPKARVLLKDPESGSNSLLLSDGSTSPTVGPDGDVFIGVLENPFPENNDRGWELHFDSTLSQAKTPGAFGWDDTPSIVPAGMVPSYTGASTYLLMSKYNNYAGVGTGDGVNKIAILDPHATEVDPITAVITMKEILTHAGVTADPDWRPQFPHAVKEWCINSAAVDPASKSILANSEDGTLYRWDLTTNRFTQRIVLTQGIGEAYTPTLVGPDGTVYAINNSILFAVGE